jgi:ATP-binding cassette subfamily B protein/ATP-binding cassette subfamily C protein/ATP-binding cassette subfamily B multidrug efflux pump
MLSGGQKQRVALARCLLTPAPIMILDDTILIVSHRLSAVRFADRILVLDGGRVVHTGRHADLLAANGYYAGTYRLQEVEEGGDAA